MPRSKNYDRDESLERAMHVFWRKGYGATSVNDLVTETRLNRFSLYHEFESKENLYLEAFERYQRTVMESRMLALEQSDGGIACLKRFFTDYIDGVKSGLDSGREPVCCLSMHNAVESIGREPEASQIMCGILERMKTAFTTVLRRAVRKQEIAESSASEENALFLVGCTYGLDVMSKYLSRSELATYVDTVLCRIE